MLEAPPSNYEQCIQNGLMEGWHKITDAPPKLGDAVLIYLPGYEWRDSIMVVWIYRGFFPDQTLLWKEILDPMRKK